MFKLYTLFFASVLLFSCVSRKKIVYFQGEMKSSANENQLKIKQGDLLQVIIYNGDESNSKLFNLPDVSTPNNGYYQGNPIKSGYLVDNSGDIEIPNFGKIHVKDLNIEQISDIIKLKVSEYIKKPVVFVRIQNFRITVLGDVKNPGTIQVPNDKISIIEAIGIAGDLNITAKRNNISVLREVNGVTKKFSIDFNKSDLFNSPVYYLCQNDIVYVEPNQAKVNSSIISSASGVFISVASLIITTINVLSK
jgi:polysaccharide export outer membrane protein